MSNSQSERLAGFFLPSILSQSMMTSTLKIKVWLQLHFNPILKKITRKFHFHSTHYQVSLYPLSRKLISIVTFSLSSRPVHARNWMKFRFTRLYTAKAIEILCYKIRKMKTTFYMHSLFKWKEARCCDNATKSQIYSEKCLV